MKNFLAIILLVSTAYGCDNSSSHRERELESENQKLRQKLNEREEPSTFSSPNRNLFSLTGVWLISANEQGTYSGGAWEAKWELKQTSNGLRILEVSDDVAYGRRTEEIQVNHFAISGRDLELITYQDWNFAKVTRAYDLEVINEDLIEGRYIDKTSSPFGGGALDENAKGSIRFFREK